MGCLYRPNDYNVLTSTAGIENNAAPQHGYTKTFRFLRSRTSSLQPQERGWTLIRVRFFNIYRPPRKDTTSGVYTDTLVKCLSSYLAKHHCNVVVGDFNCPQINCNAPLCFANDHACKAVINWIVTFGFTQFVTFPTWETSTLDLVLCDNDQFICDVSPSPPIGHSDH